MYEGEGFPWALKRLRRFGEGCAALGTRHRFSYKAQPVTTEVGIIDNNVPL